MISMLMRRVVPRLVKDVLRQFSRRAWKPNLAYIETHLVDHCNLNCKGCGHFCPVAAEWFADLSVHRRDMRRLSQLFRNIDVIRLMGGEPLLHPRVNEFIGTTRAWFPNSDVRLVTNGLLLRSMSDPFWKCCRDNRITIDMTVYPPMYDQREKLEALARTRGMALNCGTVGEFEARCNPVGDSSPDLAFSKCKSQYQCAFLRNGYVYNCSFAALTKYSNALFGLTCTSVGIGIHNWLVTGEDILDHLSRPIGNCRYCTLEFRRFDWGISRKDRNEWIADRFDVKKGTASS